MTTITFTFGATPLPDGRARINMFVKQLDIGSKCVTDINKFPAHLRIRQVPWAKKGEAR